MGLFSSLLGGGEWSGGPGDEKRAGRLRDKADREFAKGNVERSIELGVKARKFERDDEPDVPWWRR